MPQTEFLDIRTKGHKSHTQFMDIRTEEHKGAYMPRATQYNICTSLNAQHPYVLMFFCQKKYPTQDAQRPLCPYVLLSKNHNQLKTHSVLLSFCSYVKKTYPTKDAQRPYVLMFLCQKNTPDPRRAASLMSLCSYVKKKYQTQDAQRPSVLLFLCQKNTPDPRRAASFCPYVLMSKKHIRPKTRSVLLSLCSYVKKTYPTKDAQRPSVLMFLCQIS